MSAVFVEKKQPLIGEGEGKSFKIEEVLKFWTVLGNYCVGCGEEDCSRRGAPEQRTTGDQSPWASILYRKELFFVESGTESTRWQRDRMTDTVRKAKVAILKSILSLSQWGFLEVVQHAHVYFCEKRLRLHDFEFFWKQYIWSKMMSMSKEYKRLRTKEHINWTMAFLYRRWRTELVSWILSPINHKELHQVQNKFQSVSCLLFTQVNKPQIP